MTGCENNATLRALFTLPPIKESAGTALAVPEMPKQAATTGDREVDAVLWLQSLVQSGHQAYIDKALEAVKLVRTPMKVLEDRYAAYLRNGGAHVFQILFGTMGFGDLESKASAAIKKARATHDALSRFGSIEALFADTPAEKACKKSLRGLKSDRMNFYADDQASERFGKQAQLTPSTIDDCLYARGYWSDLYRLRQAAGDYGDSLPAAYAHESYCLSMLAKIKPRDASDALSAFDYLYESGANDCSDSQAILRNLIASGWEAQHQASV
jgi:hypothetical protein